MAQFELDWSMVGRATIEADDADEAELILTDNLINFDTSMFDGVDVDEVTVDSTEAVDDE
jgi:hypothetical protein